MGTITPSSGRIVIELELSELLFQSVMHKNGVMVEPHMAIGDAIRRAAWNILAGKAPYIISKHKFAYGFVEAKDGKVVVTFEEHNGNPDEPGPKP